MESHRERLKREVISGLDLSSEIEDEEIRRMIDRCILNDSGAQYMPLREKLQLKSEIYNSIRKLDVLSEFLEDDSISDASSQIEIPLYPREWLKMGLS